MNEFKPIKVEVTPLQEIIIEGVVEKEQRSLVPGFEDQEKDSKWIRSFRCGCGECRFIAPAERQSCPLENASSSIWLWTMNNDYINRLDYVDNYSISASDELEVDEVENSSPPPTDEVESLEA